VDNIYEWYQALDLTIVASVREGLARSMIESLACGTPVVSFDVCSAREILEGYRCGFVVPKGEYSALLEQIRYLIEHPELRQAFGEAGARAAVELFDPVYVVQKYEDLYLSLSKVRDEL
jgi:glycosyltransferase involved in cell wall biosynthesis